MTDKYTHSSNSNLLEAPFDTPYGVPHFDRISINDYEPAIRKGIEHKLEEIEKICANQDTPDFDNTIVAFERSGNDLNRVLGVFYPMLSAMSTDELMEVSSRMIPQLSDMSTRIILNERLWRRIKSVYDHRERMSLTPQDLKLLEETYEGFRHSGALLTGEARERYAWVMSRLSELTEQFGQNVLREMNSMSLTVDRSAVEGLPDDIIAEAGRLAAERGESGKYILTLHQPVYTAVMRDAHDRSLRERMWRAYMGRNMSGSYDNRAIICEIVRLRAEKAVLLGFGNYAEYSLCHTMAQSPEKVNNLLNQLREAYIEAGHREIEQLARFAAEDGFTDEAGLRPWDYSYYSNRMRRALYDYDVQALRPYFELESVIKGVFGLAGDLYGIRFEQRADLPVYHPDVKVFEAIDSDGSSLGILYTDFFPRETKRPGAWMTEFREQSVDADGNEIRPIVSIVMNFSKPSEGKPSLLTPGEVRTLLHEFGHALHSLFSKVRYASLAGTSVYRDFVELPSQFNENFLTTRKFLDSFARHYETGEPIPSGEIDKIVATEQFGAAYACLRQLSFGLLDMSWHSFTQQQASELIPEDIPRVELEAMAPVALFDQDPSAIMSTQFSHIFSGGYAAGYYSYKWAEVLDADAFAAFRERGCYDRNLAESFRRIILQNGGTSHPAELYRRWRGRDATIDALLIRDGIR